MPFDPSDVVNPKDLRRVPIFQVHQARELDCANPDRWMVHCYWTLMTDQEMQEHRSRYLRRWRFLYATTRGWRRHGWKGRIFPGPQGWRPSV